MDATRAALVVLRRAPQVARTRDALKPSLIESTTVNARVA
jgi:hypothetical protein